MSKHLPSCVSEKVQLVIGDFTWYDFFKPKSEITMGKSQNLFWVASLPCICKIIMLKIFDALTNLKRIEQIWEESYFFLHWSFEEFVNLFSNLCLKKKFFIKDNISLAFFLGKYGKIYLAVFWLQRICTKCAFVREIQLPVDLEECYFNPWHEAHYERNCKIP